MKFICIILAMVLVFGIGALDAIPGVMNALSFAVDISSDILLPTHLRQDPKTFDDSFTSAVLNSTGLTVLDEDGSVWSFEPRLYRHSISFEALIHNDQIVVAYRTQADGDTQKFLAHIDDRPDTEPYLMLGMFAVTTTPLTAPLVRAVIIPALRETTTLLEDVINV